MIFKNLLAITAYLLCTTFINVKETKAQNKPVEPTEKRIGGAERQRQYFKRYYAPYDRATAERNNELWQNIDANFPSENNLVAKLAAINSWQLLGPFGASQTNLAIYKYSGRVTHLELTTSNNDDLKVMAASGNLWKYQPTTLVGECLTNGLNSPHGGAFVTDPTNSNHILVGTGEPQVAGGTGLWQTYDGGITWSAVTITPTPDAFYHLMYDPGNSQKIHAATEAGYYRSDDGGQTWTRYRSGNCTDVVVDYINPMHVYTAFWNTGLYKSTDGGNTHTVMNTGGAPTTTFGRTALAISQQNSGTVYACVTNNSGNDTKGIYKTTDGGVTWTTCTISGNTNFHANQGWYNNVISVSPVNDNIVLAGGVTMVRTQNGTTFTSVDTRHADQHAVVWNANGTDVFVGNDGGVYRSANSGLTFSNTLVAYGYNNLPITQYYHLSGGKSDPNTMGASAQDNGVHVKSATNAYNWTVIAGGDGAAIAINPFDANELMYSTGVFSGSLQSRRFFSTDGGSTSTDVNTGIATCDDWFPEVRVEGQSSIYYTACNRRAYYTTDFGQNWQILNPTLFPSDVTDFTVGANVTGTPNIYACMSSGTIKLMVYDNTTLTWVNRTAGLPTNTYCRKVAPHVTDADVAYAVMGGIPSTGAGNKIFKTTDRGITWTNVSGNLPNVALNDLFANPADPNYLYVASEIGGFKTTDGGVTWKRWNNGMPESVIITELDYIDSVAINGKFYITCSTYGRSVWMREVSGDDPVTAGINSISSSAIFDLYQNSNNPGGDETLIGFALKQNAEVSLDLYDIYGNHVANMLKGFKNAGKHMINFDRKHLKRGTYFYKLTSGNYSATKKMVVVN
ncbi:MAG: T9SS type A sorting domain-containing protein [Bacteroidia bacterium]|nr:T9SS type A sorting domain-containing protein [Bacteroidia bacterium]